MELLKATGDEFWVGGLFVYFHTTLYYNYAVGQRKSCKKVTYRYTIVCETKIQQELIQEQMTQSISTAVLTFFWSCIVYSFNIPTQNYYFLQAVPSQINSHCQRLCKFLKGNCESTTLHTTAMVLSVIKQHAVRPSSSSWRQRTETNLTKLMAECRMPMCPYNRFPIIIWPHIILRAQLSSGICFFL